MHWVARIDQERNFRGARNQFPEDFYSFCDEISWRVGRKTRYVAARTREALDEAEPHGIDHSHEYNRNAGGCRFQGYGCLWAGGDEQIGTESNQLGGESWQAILGVGITILDNQVFSIDPAVVSQPVKPRFAEWSASGSSPWRESQADDVSPAPSERRGETSSAAVAAMNSRRFIRSSSQLEDDGTQSITSRWSSHSLRVQMLRRKCRAWRKTAMGQTRTSSLGAARPLPPSADIGPGGQSVGQAAQFCLDCYASSGSLDLSMHVGISPC